MYFARSQFGHWLNHHYHKGMPRGFGPAQETREVPAVTGACLVMRRTAVSRRRRLLHRLCHRRLRGQRPLPEGPRRRALAIVYVPSVELYHFERQSIRHSEEYMRGNADRYNAWLHASRWGGAMDALMQAFEASSR